MKDLWLIRHAESVANAGSATDTPREVQLSDNGLRQADRLPEMLTARPDLIILSPYVRAQETAEPFLKLYAGIRTETMHVQEFTYLSVERCRGTTHEARKPLVTQYWDRSDPLYCDVGQAESFSEFIWRCRDFQRKMAEKDFELAFVFTHEQVIKALLWDAIYPFDEVDAAAMRSYKDFMLSYSIPNASVTRTKIDLDGEYYFGRTDPVLAKNHA